MLTNDYRQATAVEGGLFAVQMTDGGWTVADGPGTSVMTPDDDEVAGYHLPVRFQTEIEAVEAIKSGPDAMFDIAPDCEWTIHCVGRGGILTEAYEFDADATDPYEIEPVGGGFIVADYTGLRGRLGAAYAGVDGLWQDQPISVRDPFASDEAARKWAAEQTYS